eukprot:g29213.t1
MQCKKQRPLGPEVPGTPTVRQRKKQRTVEPLKPTASLGGNQQSGMQSLDKELVLRIEKGELRGDELTLSVWGLGGQEVFRSLLQLFLKRGAAYLVLFDMRQLVPSASEQDRRDCLDSLRFWMRSLEVHACDEALESPAPPVFLVGTNKDSKQLQLHEYRTTGPLKNYWIRNSELSQHIFPGMTARRQKTGDRWLSIQSTAWQETRCAISIDCSCMNLV